MTDPSAWTDEAEGWPGGMETVRRERGEQGFSYADWINFDTYIAWVIANAVEKMKTDGHTMFSYPDEPEDQWAALTQRDYDTMVKGFRQWADYGHGLAFPGTLDDDLDAALEIFKKRFRSLWD
jgi:Holliday junction resolvase RusA-like endonuclease